MSSDRLALEVSRAARKLSPGHLETMVASLVGIANPAETGARAKVVGAVKAPSYGAIAGKVFDAWLGSANGITGAGVALALEAASVVAGREAEDERVSLVMTGPTTQEVPAGSIYAALKDVIRAAEERLIIVSFAAYKVDDMVDELLAAAGRGVELTLILETDKADGGNLTFGAKKAFSDLKGKASFYVWPPDKRPDLGPGKKASMHAKAAIADAKCALVTSANFTGQGVTANLELGLLVHGGDVPRRLADHFRELISTEVLTPASL